LSGLISLNPIHGFLIYVSSSLLRGYDESKIISYANSIFCLVNADGGHSLGIPGEFDNPKFTEATARVMSA